MCHGAPGKDAADWVLHPPPPDLVEALVDQAWSDAEVFWIIKYGIKDTAMPGFAPSHDDRDLWTIAALIRRLPQIDAAQYAAMVERGRARDSADESHRAPDHR